MSGFFTCHIFVVEDRLLIGNAAGRVLRSWIHLLLFDNVVVDNHLC
jgi:hypothetical protein